MFLHLSVILFGGGVSATDRHPRQTPPWEDTPLCPVHAGIQPPAQCMLGYGQQAGDTHPTGIHSCGVYIRIVTKVSLMSCLPVMRSVCESVFFLLFFWKYVDYLFS